jgi:Mn-dependent DtxR family transcriptional regulator
MMRPPTARQLETLRAMRDYQRREQMPPTLRELAAILGVRSTNGVLGILRSLERRGLVERPRPGTPHCWRLTEQGRRAA